MGKLNARIERLVVVVVGIGNRGMSWIIENHTTLCAFEAADLSRRGRQICVERPSRM